MTRLTRNAAMNAASHGLPYSPSPCSPQKQVVIHPQVEGASRGATTTDLALPFPAMNEIQR